MTRGEGHTARTAIPAHSADDRPAATRGATLPCLVPGPPRRGKSRRDRARSRTARPVRKTAARCSGTVGLRPAVRRAGCHRTMPAKSTGSAHRRVLMSQFLHRPPVAPMAEFARPVTLDRAHVSEGGAAHGARGTSTHHRRPRVRADRPERRGRARAWLETGMPVPDHGRGEHRHPRREGAG
jgi:hypothetical protein